MQVEEILNEVKFSQYVETGECKTDIDLPDFIRCNYHLDNVDIVLLSTWHASDTCNPRPAVDVTSMHGRRASRDFNV